jgi:hypothetical protein
MRETVLLLTLSDYRLPSVLRYAAAARPVAAFGHVFKPLRVRLTLPAGTGGLRAHNDSGRTALDLFDLPPTLARELRFIGVGPVYPVLHITAVRVCEPNVALADYFFRIQLPPIRARGPHCVAAWLYPMDAGVRR